MTHLADHIDKLPTTARDLTYLFLGEVLGNGMSRSVYAHERDKSLVIKVESGGNRFQNVLEWEFWQTVKDTKMAKWFAPCVEISPNGIFLIQKRADMIPKNQYPKKIPKFFTDLKYQNFGMIGKQFVCFDYGTAHINAINNHLSTKLVTSKFWED